MRLALAAALAALAFAVPAAAQPDPARILVGALERTARNVPEEVDDYTMALSWGGLEMDVYVAREHGQFYSMGENQFGVAGLLVATLLWPRLAMVYEPKMDARHRAILGVRYLRADSVDGRPVHVLLAPGLDVPWELIDAPDSVVVFVDTETRQFLHLAVAGTTAPQAEGPLMNGGRVQAAFTFGDYRETDGVTVPRRVRMEMRIQTELSEENSKELREEVHAVMVMAREEDPEHAEQQVEAIRGVMRMVRGEPWVLESTIGDVRVNTGLPDWVH